MQLVPLLMALRDRVGLERVIVDTYQAVSGTGHKAVAELEATRSPAHVAAQDEQPRSSQVLHPIAFNALPDTSTCSGTTATPRRSGRSSTRAARSCTCRTSPLLHGRPRAGLLGPLGGGPRGHPRAHHARAAPVSCSRPWRAWSWWTTRRPVRYPLATDAAAPTRSTSVASARTSRADGRCRGLAFWVVLRTTCARAPRRTPPDRARRRAGLALRRHRGGPAAPRDPGRAADGASRPSPSEVRVCTAAGSHDGRTERGPGRGPSRHRGRVRGRGARAKRGPAGPAVRRRRRAACSTSCSRRSAGGASEVFITNVVKCRPPGNRDPGAGRDRRLRAVPAAPARGARPGARRDARPLLAADVHARRAHRPGPRHGAAGRPRDRRTRCRAPTRCTTPPRRSARQPARDDPARHDGHPRRAARRATGSRAQAAAADATRGRIARAPRTPDRRDEPDRGRPAAPHDEPPPTVPIPSRAGPSTIADRPDCSRRPAGSGASRRLTDDQLGLFA